jgi:hypothetical protein
VYPVLCGVHLLVKKLLYLSKCTVLQQQKSLTVYFDLLTDIGTGVCIIHTYMHTYECVWEFVSGCLSLSLPHAETITLLPRKPSATHLRAEFGEQYLQSNYNYIHLNIYSAELSVNRNETGSE